MKVNVFWLTQFVKYGHRPVVFLRMPTKRYAKAKDCKPIISLGVYGPIRLLETSEHKTNDQDLAFVPIPEADEWQWLKTYIRRLRPAPADDECREPLFLNFQGSALSNPCDIMKTVFDQIGVKVLTHTEWRHAIQPVAFNNLDQQDREDVCTALCHTPGTTKRSYIDNMIKKTVRGLDAIINSIIKGSKKKSYTTASVGPSSEEPVALLDSKSYRHLRK